MEKKSKIREFFATSWAIDNRTSIYVLTVLVTLVGMMSYRSIPKEQFPEVVIPTIMVTTIYPGTAPEDIENLVTRPLEKQLKGINGVKKISSNSLQDFSSVVVEFKTDVDVADAKQKVKDAIDKAKTDLPTDLPNDPSVMEIDLSEIPIATINLSGAYDLVTLKKYAKVLQDQIEGLSEITRVDIVGALDREIHIDVDYNKMRASGISFTDIERATAAENLIISIGSIKEKGFNRSVSVKGQFADVETIGNIMISAPRGGTVFLKDIANVTDSYKEQESYARFKGNNVITLNIIKKSGENLLDASDKIKEILDNAKKTILPKDLKVDITGEQSKFTRNTLEELNNTIIIGFILVTIILMFFMGFNNAFFVGLSVPLAMMISYMVLPGIGFTMNMIVMFAFIFALGIIVDDAIVVVENTHRVHKFEPDIVKAAKHAAGEVFYPILSGTLTTLAPFFPLAFWPGIVGQFMHYLPVTIIIALFASLLVAYLINPVFAVSYMKNEYIDVPTKPNYRKIIIRSGIALVIALLLHLVSMPIMANAIIIGIILYLIFIFLIKKTIYNFQNKVWPRFLNAYERVLEHTVKGRRPVKFFIGIVVLLFSSFVLTAIVKPQVLFFPDNDPSLINVLIKMPKGTDVLVTDSISKVVEQRVINVLGKDNPIVESVNTNVALGADPNSFDRSISPEKAKVSVNFVESKYRQGVHTSKYLDEIRKELKDFPGAVITVEKNRMGPPTGKPINIEFYSENLENLIEDTRRFKAYVDSVGVPGIEELKSDLQDNKPELLIEVNRVKANNEGVSTGQIGMLLRTGLFGKEISKFKEDEEEYPIVLRLDAGYRENVNYLLNMNLAFRDMATGRFKEVPVSSLVDVKYGSSYGGIRRVNNKRAITLSSEVLGGYTANDIIKQLTQLMPGFRFSDGTTFKFTGEQENQKESSDFLGMAMLIALALIFFILITQFNSIGKTLIILSEVIFSIIGVLIGVALFNMPIVIAMTGIGIVALGGIVVRNGILLLEFADQRKAQGATTRRAIIEAGKTRITPVVLTALSTILGLVPLAVGMNINFLGLLSSWSPDIYFGGDNVMFWGPLSWTIIFGLAFATVLTLLFLPSMYVIYYRIKSPILRRGIKKRIGLKQV